MPSRPPRAAAGHLFLVLPVRGHAVLRAPVHPPRPDLQLDRLAARADHRGVQRLVHVELRHRDVVLEPPGNGVPPGVHRAEGRVAVAYRVHQDADAHQVVDVVEAHVAGDHLLVDGVVVLGPARHPRLDLGLAQVGGDVLDDLLEEDIAARGPLGDQPGDLVVPLGVERREGQVLEFPLDGVHAEPVGQRREDLQRLPRLALLLLPGQVAQRAHVVQPVGELDDQDPDVTGHGDDHLAHGLGLGDLAVLDLVQLGDPVDQGGDLVTEVGPQLVEGVGGVLHRVVQQGRAQRLVVHAQLGQDGGHGERVGDVRVAALALLAGMPVRGHVVGVLDQPDVGLRVGRAHRLDHRLEDGVDPAAAGRPEPGQPPRRPPRSGAPPGARPPAGAGAPASPRAPAGGRAPAVGRPGTGTRPGAG